ADFLKGHPHKIPHCRRHTGGNDEVFRLVLLEDEPHSFNVVLSMTPVALCIQVSEIKLILESKGDAGHSPGNFAGHEGLAPEGGLVVKEDPIAGIHAISLPVIHGNPVPV